MDHEQTEKQLNDDIEKLCKSKSEEFHLLGYESLSGQDIWNFIDAKYEKTGYPRLHQLVSDILSLKVTDMMNWMTMNAYKSAYKNENPFV